MCDSNPFQSEQTDKRKWSDSEAGYNISSCETSRPMLLLSPSTYVLDNNTANFLLKLSTSDNGCSHPAFHFITFSLVATAREPLQRCEQTTILTKRQIRFDIFASLVLSFFITLSFVPCFISAITLLLFLRFILPVSVQSLQHCFRFIKAKQDSKSPGCTLVTSYYANSNTEMSLNSWSAGLTMTAWWTTQKSAQSF